MSPVVDAARKKTAITWALRGDVVIDAVVLDSPQWQRTGECA